ncbi:MAG: O-antigen/teichoic acid export membrane protein [Cocleimonas sp.]|jgi:O-antigen/teichoic acid export membrane protein
MLKKIKKYFLDGESSDVFKGMLTLLIGSGFARIVSLLSIPILVRIYGPEDYGVLAIYMSIVAIIAPIMTLRYTQAIPLPKTDLMAFNLLSVCLKLILFFSLVISFVSALWGDVILTYFNMEALIPWKWLIVLGVLGSALYELLSLWATRKKQYKVIAKSQFMQSLIGNAVKVTLGLFGFKPIGMLIGQFFSQSAGVTIFIKNAREDFKCYTSKIESSKEKLVAAYYQSFVWFRLPSQFLMVLSTQAPVIMIAKLFDASIVGQFGLAKMALMLPSSLIGQAVSKAYFAEVASIGKNNLKKINHITSIVQKKLFLVSIPIALLIIFFAESGFCFLFGDEWRVAGQYAAILAPSMLFAFTSSPLIQVLNIIGSQSVFLFINVIRFLLMAGLFLYANFHPIIPTVFLYFYSAIMTVFYIGISLYIFVCMSRRS